MTTSECSTDGSFIEIENHNTTADDDRSFQVQSLSGTSLLPDLVPEVLDNKCDKLSEETHLSATLANGSVDAEEGHTLLSNEKDIHLAEPDDILGNQSLIKQVMLLLCLSGHHDGDSLVCRRSKRVNVTLVQHAIPSPACPTNCSWLTRRRARAV